MSNNENYVSWAPIKGIPSRFICEEIHDDYDGVKIVLKEQFDPGYTIGKAPRLLQITFDPLIAYRNIDESYRTRTFDLAKDRNDALFLVKN